MKTFSNGYALIVGVGDDLPITVSDTDGIRDVLVNPNLVAYNEIKVPNPKEFRKPTKNKN